MKNRRKEMQETNKKTRGRDGETRRNILAFCSQDAKTAREIIDGLSLSKTVVYKILKNLREKKWITVLDKKIGNKSLYLAKGYKGAPSSVAKPKEKAGKKDSVSFSQKVLDFIKVNPGVSAREIASKFSVSSKKASGSAEYLCFRNRIRLEKKDGIYCYFPVSRDSIQLNFRIWDNAIRHVVRSAI